MGLIDIVEQNTIAGHFCLMFMNAKKIGMKVNGNSFYQFDENMNG